ncbi:N-acetylmuramoyl-L-alanine amidase [Desmospora activa]|uniref:N-acetylmuramoyl-L-alanine amidase n=1 Tax=Desmospora activa DSM 45169 TaxID=1121389 RepID=A0A2T4ZDS0_9BACL|nr:N-acetylmuramoyl-L-alanine amidase [Desmospora activa]PTM60037.1 N-acetylmuramoyl-L-alanine amidase [Desmospora activa DSM 45169]
MCISSRITLVISFFVLLLLLLLSPVIPASWAQPSSIEVMADEVYHQTSTHFEKGKKSNLEVKPRGKKAEITVKNEEKLGEYQSPVITAEFPFTDAVIHWNEGKGPVHLLKEQERIRFYVRTSADKQEWTPWQSVDVDPLEGPDHLETERFYSNLITVDYHQYLQYKAVLDSAKDADTLQDVTVVFLNSTDGKSTASADTVSLASLLSEKAIAAVNRPAIVSRAQWGADESLRYLPDGSEDWPRQYATSVTHLAVHHTDTPNDDPNPEARMRSIYYYHAKTRGWGDIGYNAIIGSDGRIYEGRKGKDSEVLTPGVVAAHAYSFNYGSFGVSLMGNYSEKKLPAAMRKSLIDLLVYQADLHKIDPLGKKDFVRNYEYNDPNVPRVDRDVPTLQGHKDFPRHSTACPGTYVHADLPNIRNDVKAKMDAANGEVTVDNLDSANRTVGTWNQSTNVQGYYGSNYQTRTKGSGANTFTWNFQLPTAGTYEVFVHYTAAFDRATNAPYTVHAKTGAVTKRVNQQSNGGKWVSIGSYSFDSGANKIIQSDDANGYIIADAVRLKLTAEAPPLTERVIDNADQGATAITGTWNTSSNVQGYWGTNYRTRSAGSGANTFTWKFTPGKTGVYRISTWYPSGSDRATNAPFTVTYDGGSYTQRINQKQNGGRWVEVGVFPFQAGQEGRVRLTDNADGYVIADAVRFEWVPNMTISDNDDAGNTATGDNWVSSTAIKTYYGSDYIYNHKGTGEDTFTWNLDIPTSGTYKIYTRFQPYTNRATDAPYTVRHRDGEKMVRINQQENNGVWVELGTYTFEKGGTNQVMLSDDASGLVVADAILVEPVGQ